jgi:hypothetical protein
MKASVRIAVGFAALIMFSYGALKLMQAIPEFQPESIRPTLLFVAAPALLVIAGFGLAAIIKGAKEL